MLFTKRKFSISVCDVIILPHDAILLTNVFFAPTMMTWHKFSLTTKKLSLDASIISHYCVTFFWSETGVLNQKRKCHDIFY